MPEPYSNRELDAKFDNLSVLVKEKHDDLMVKIGEIIVQTKKTNGSVASLKIWRAYMTGAIAVILFLVTAIAIPLAAAYISR